MTSLRQIIDVFSGPKPFNIVLPVVMIYLVAGTVAQKYIGLYAATRMFFSSPILWLGPLPLPGFPVFLAIITVNLTLKLIYKSPWTKEKSGIVVTHLGALLLLLGGLFTSLFSAEAYLDLLPGEEKSIVSDYHDREFVFLNAKGQALRSFPANGLDVGKTLRISDPPLVIKILESCGNCSIVAREDTSGDFKGMAANMSLKPAPLKMQDEENLTGATFSIQGSSDDGNYLVLDEVPKLPEIRVDKEIFRFALRKTQRPLPFTVKLLEFRRDLHPGTEMARAYESRVEIIDGPSRWETVISMNQPLRYKGYTFFQSSFVQTPAGEMSVLAVVHNVGRIFPYLSGILMCLGLILHLLMGRRKKSKAMVLALCLMTQFGHPAWADDKVQKLTVDNLALLPVLHEGRIKPLESFARAHLKRFSGRDSLPDMNALGWLTETLFDPARAETRPVFKINNPEIRALLGLSLSENHLYSFKEISEKLGTKQKLITDIINAPQESWTPAQKDMIALQENIVLMDNLMSSLTLFLPLSVILPEDVPDSLKPYAGKPLNYLDVQKFREQMDSELNAIIKAKGQDIESYTQAEQAVVYLSFSITRLREKGQRSTQLKLIPDTVGQNEDWLSPWASVLAGKGSPQTAMLFEHWKKLAAAYHDGNAQEWLTASRELRAERGKSPFRTVSHITLELEHLYHRLAPFSVAFALYLVAAATLIGYLFLKSGTLLGLSLIPLLLGACFQWTGLAMRIAILQRPPVTTLYESILFVGAIAVVYALISFVFQRKPLWLALGAFSGILLGLLAFAHETDADSFVMLTAVLNTNFWLATHVLCITVGYAFCLITALLAHWILFLMLNGKTNEPPPDLFQKLHLAALLALLFCAVGTVLGGIWADQSWGRFWGWDPKENGALLLVLWLVWLMHGRISRQFSALVYTAGLAYLSAILAISWFGVNLLSVGLHAYGFTESAAWIFWGVLLGETLFALSAIIMVKINLKQPLAHES
ncbi:MAG: cytochrome c biogenesis protein ResB [Alphaproteobacteria bacterium]|nr:cytochrome c biogenesis protein ResB [Alphaproteobacteria bacterium]QQS56582.1 MAG: cytochrome c biogenesis protein ResB [Alphaproteobacteria bacterium]